MLSYVCIPRRICIWPKCIHISLLILRYLALVLCWGNCFEKVALLSLLWKPSFSQKKYLPQRTNAQETAARQTFLKALSWFESIHKLSWTLQWYQMWWNPYFDFAKIKNLCEVKFFHLHVTIRKCFIYLSDALGWAPHVDLI